MNEQTQMVIDFITRQRSLERLWLNDNQLTADVTSDILTQILSVPLCIKHLKHLWLGGSCFNKPDT